MIEEKLSSPGQPWERRVLVPFIAKLLPLRPADSLRLISYISLLGFYLVLFVACSRLGLNVYLSVAGLFAVFSTTFHLYHYHNPFLTDAFAVMTFALMILSLLIDCLPLFIGAAILGILSWEVTICLVPVWFIAKDRLKGTIVIIIAIIVALIPNLLMPAGVGLGGDYRTVKSLLLLCGREFSGVLHDPWGFIRGTMLGWGFVWFLGILGVCLLPRDRHVPITTAFFLLFVGAFLGNCISNDPERVWSNFLVPVFAISCAQLFSTLTRIPGRIAWVSILVALLLAQLLASRPNVFFDEASWVFRSHGPRLVLQVCGTIYSLSLAFVLRGALLQSVCEKLAEIRRAIGRLVGQNAPKPESV
jgi:hypothetical protein